MRTLDPPTLAAVVAIITGEADNDDTAPVGRGACSRTLDRQPPNNVGMRADNDDATPVGDTPGGGLTESDPRA